MADRVVKVTLRAQVAEYKQGMLEAAKATRETGTEAEKLAQKKEAFDQFGKASLAMGVTIGAGITMAVGKFAEFDEAMSFVAATGQDARDSLDELRDAAIEAGARTVFSATESANAIEEMAKAGIDASDILGGGLAGALDLAAAGGLGVADAAGIAAVALKTFKLEGSDMSHVADLLAAGAGKAMGDVQDLAYALSQGGQVAAATGLSIEETTAALASFAAQGLLGSDAGTSLKTMLQRLTPQSDAAARKFEELGISAYDASGHFVGLADFAGQLQAAMASLTPEQRNAAMSIMFGSDAVRAANVLYSEGEQGIRDWIAAVDDQGYAAETAATRLDNLKGDWEAFGGAVDSAMINMGEAANGPLRIFVQTLTEMVDGFGELPAPVQQAVFWIAAAGSAAAVAGGLFLTGTPKVVAYNAALATLGPTAQKADAALRGLGKVAGVAIGVAGFVALTEVAKTATREITNVDQVTRELVSSGKSLHQTFVELNPGQVIDSWSGALDALGEHQSNVFARMSGLWDENMRDALGLAGTLEELGGVLGSLATSNLPAAQEQFAAYVRYAGASEEQTWSMINAASAYKDALVAQIEAAGLVADKQTILSWALGESETATDENTGALEELEGQAVATEISIEDLTDAIRGFGGYVLNTREAARQFESALDTLQDSIEKNGTTLDITTAKGRENESAVDAMARATLDYAATLTEQTGRGEDAAAVIAEGRERLIEMLAQLDITGQEAEEYADKLGLIPSDVESTVHAHTEQAEADINHVARDRETVIRVTQYVSQVISSATDWAKDNYRGGLYESGVQEFYQGGFASGIYRGITGGIHKFAESERGVPWETYISGRAQDRDRNIGIWMETGKRLGVGGSGDPYAGSGLDERLTALERAFLALPGELAEVLRRDHGGMRGVQGLRAAMGVD